MDPHGGLDEVWMTLGQLEGPFRARQVPARDHDANDPRLLGALDDRLAAAVEGGMLEVAMGVDQARQPLRRPMASQEATPGEVVSRIGSSGGVSSSDPPSSGSSVRGNRG